MTIKKLLGYLIIIAMAVGFLYILVDMIMQTWWLIFVPIGAAVTVMGLLLLANYLINSPAKQPNNKKQPL